MAKKVFLIVGPVGAGKSTFAHKLRDQHKAVHFDLDDWMVGLFKPDRPNEGLMPWYAERTERCINRIWATTLQLITAETNVVLEIGLLGRLEREAFYARVDAEAIDLVIHVLDAPRELRRARVRERNQTQGVTFSMLVPDDIFELASDLWQPPSELECLDREVIFHNA